MSVRASEPIEHEVVIPMSWEEYERRSAVEPYRCEYVGGSLVMNPVGAFRHHRMRRKIAAALEAACDPRYVVVEEWAWKPGADEWIPDVMVCSQPDPEAVRSVDTPLLLVEVLSSNRAADLVRKMFKYAAAGLPRYWIADPAEPSVRAFELRHGIFEEVAASVGAAEAEFDFGAGRVRLRASDLLP